MAMKFPVNRDELVEIRRALAYLHEEVHHPGAARNENHDVDALANEALRIIDHALNS